MKNFIIKPINIQVFNTITATHPQYAEESLLYDSISDVLGCSKKNAKDFAKTHCNMISTYAILRSAGFYKENYSEFFKFCLDNNYCNAKGFVLVLKSVITNKLGVEPRFNVYRDYEDIVNPFRIDSDRFVQYKIKANTTGDHFMGGFISGGELFISDTSYRGIGVKAVDFINQKNFQWVMEY